MDWFIFFAAVAASALPVHDKDFPCTDSTSADRYVQDFSIDVESFGGRQLCNPAADIKKLFNDLALVEGGAFSGSGQNLFIRGFVPASGYYQWLAQQTRGIERGNDIPWATAYNSWGYFTMQDGWAKLSTLGRVGVVLHEARHTEGYSHTLCDHGPYQASSVSGCDTNLSAGGSHAIEMEYYARVQVQGVNFHPVYQAMARLMLLGRANFVFNESPVAARDTLLARTTGGLIRVDASGSQEIPWESPGSESFALKRTSLGATLLNLPYGAWSVELTHPEVSPVHSDDYSYFKILKMTPPAGLTDMEEVDIGTRRFVFAADSQGRIFSYIFGQGSWSSGADVGTVNRLTTTSPAGKSGIFAIFADQTFCELNPRRGTCDSEPNAWPSDTRKFIQFRNQTLRLGSDNKVYDSRGNLYPPLAPVEVLDATVIPEYGVFE